VTLEWLVFKEQAMADRHWYDEVNGQGEDDDFELDDMDEDEQLDEEEEEWDGEDGEDEDDLDEFEDDD